MSVQIYGHRTASAEQADPLDEQLIYRRSSRRRIDASVFDSCAAILFGKEERKRKAQKKWSCFTKH
jgi:hypothetical protein